MPKRFPSYAHEFLNCWTLESNHILPPCVREHLNFTGTKLSRSRGAFVEVPYFLSRYDADALRFYLSATAPETRDTEFSWEDFVERNNRVLSVNEGASWWRRGGTWAHAQEYLGLPESTWVCPRVLGFAQEYLGLLSFAYKRFDGRVPEPGELDDACKFRATPSVPSGQAWARPQLRSNCSADAMRQPWFQIKEDRQAAASVYVILRAVDDLKTILAPILPHTAQQLHEYMGYEGQLFGTQRVVEYEEEMRSHRALTYDHSGAIGTWTKSELPAGQALRAPAPLFKKLDESVVEEEYARLEG